MANSSCRCSAAVAAVALVAAGLALASAQAQADEAQCPPPGYNSLAPFDLDAYVDGPWYIQQQIPVSYQPEDTLFCVRANYEKLPNGRLLVQNSDSVRRPDFLFQLNAVQRNGSKLAVGPSFLPPNLYGPYWIVAAGPKSSDDPDFDGYEWAIITGGRPTRPSNGACLPGSGEPGFLGNFEGFWLFTREQVASEELIEEMRGVASDKGLDVSALIPVPQGAEGNCTYPPIEPASGTCGARRARCRSDADCCSENCARAFRFFGARRCQPPASSSDRN